MRFTVFILAGVLIAGCTSPADDKQSIVIENPFEGSLESAPIELMIDQVFGTEDGPSREVLARVRDVEVDPAGNVYILGDDRVVSFEHDGSFRWEINQQGDGPGELGRASGIALHPRGDLYVNNQFGTRYEVFTHDGEFIRTIPVNSLGHNRVSLVGFTDDTTAVGHRTLSGMLGTQIIILNTGEQWSVRHSFEVDQEEDADIPEMLTREPDVEMMGDRIVLNHLRRYEMSVLSLDGDTLRVVRRNASDYLRPGIATFENGQRGTALFSSLSGPVSLTSGYHLVSGFWPRNVSDPDAAAALAFRGEAAPADFYRTLDIYDENWQLLYSVDGEAFDSLGVEDIAVTADRDFLYSKEVDPYPRVVRYRVAEVD